MANDLSVESLVEICKKWEGSDTPLPRAHLDVSRTAAFGFLSTVGRGWKVNSDLLPQQIHDSTMMTASVRSLFMSANIH
jgi:hypothetical protein